ncbi:GAF and ANTAR domain-containing protein [Diaminobutyricibacter tongyongensis]|uniref:GAF and ANTAR domain-containing protein n=1 Tax=Leifsonia tongyongensis TaxID=1268043 RepID=A0A6L9Y018_9MICO|nr:GAF and ANTAR domain-containing protein [Diaminobutyricibacter tongyongensis]NEN06618.1 GAF and ANTAR domain-containing protein [Diaminobutyricibacter tongyongensis]
MSTDARDIGVVNESREARLMATFVTLADTLVAGYDVVDLLHTLVEECVEILGIEAAGIVLSDPAGALHPIASSDGWSERVEVAQVDAGEGPCVESFRTGAVVVVDDIDAYRPSRFREAAIAAGFRSVLAVPLRLRTSTIGAMNLFGRSAGALQGEDAAVARALADVATIGILQERAIRDGRVLSDQLEHALGSRVLIEQAKGVVSQTRQVPVDEAFAILRSYARQHNERLRDVAERVVERRLNF